jgi:hypothetical protein
MRLIEDRRRGFLRWQPIPDPDGVIYLMRLWLVKFVSWALALHWIRKADYSRDPHDHPWWFLSLVLRGGYKEITLQHPEGHWIRRWHFNFKPLGVTGQHVITEVLPGTITLVLRGKNKHEWGFYTSRGFIDADTYEKAFYGR